MRKCRPYLGVGWGLVFVAPAMALDGATPLEITALDIAGTDWTIRELYTTSNTITSIADAGYTAKTTFDGMGAFDLNSGTVRVVFNHELTDPNSSISYLDLNKANVQNWITAGTTAAPSQVVTHIGKAYDTITGSASLGRFCSSTLMEANRFGANSGTASRLYMTGEEVAGGSVYAIDCDPGSSTYRTMYECTALPKASWEQQVQIDTGRTDKVGLLLLEDNGYNANGSSPLRLWIGNKRDVDGNGQLSFLEKNGLAEGAVYYWVPGGGTAAPSRFTTTGDQVSGAWSTSSTGAMLFSKLEDGHLSPTSGLKVAFNCEDQGTFTVDLSLSFNPDGTLNAGATAAAVKLLLEEARDGGPAAGFNNQDNLVWSTSTKIFTQEDGDTQQIWQIDPTSANATRDALAIARVTGGAGESSGIFDISELFGYIPGSLLLTSSLSGTAADSQMVLMISPTAALAPEPSALLSLLIPAGLQRRRRRLAK